MIYPRLDDLLDQVGGSRYALVLVAAKRARQINNYHHQLGEGIGFEEAPPPLIESRSKNYLTMAMEEVANGKIRLARSRELRQRRMARIPARRDRWDRGLQGLHPRPAARPRRTRGAPRAHGECRAVRRRRDVRRARAAAPSDDPYPHLGRFDLLVVAPLTANTLRGSRTGSPTTSSPRPRSRTPGRCSSRRR
jgi:DNA-directed RNA polymerase subunit omega